MADGLAHFGGGRVVGVLKERGLVSTQTPVFIPRGVLKQGGKVSTGRRRVENSAQDSAKMCERAVRQSAKSLMGLWDSSATVDESRKHKRMSVNQKLRQTESLDVTFRTRFRNR